MLLEREEEAYRQVRILRQQQQAQHAKHAAGDVVRAVPAMAGKRRLDILYELQELVDKRLAWLIFLTICHNTTNCRS